MSVPIIRSETDRPDKIHRLYKGEVDDVDKSKRTVTATITTDAIDRYHEVILAKGIQLDNFRENPVVLWCHAGTVVIGKNLWIKRFTKDGKSGLIAKTLFAKTEKAEEVFQLYCQGFLNGWSIGASPDWSAYGQPTEEEVKARPELKKCRCVYRKVELLEYSAVSIPANPDAIGNEIGKGISAELRREIEMAPEWLAKMGEDVGQDMGQDRPKIDRKAELPPLPGVLPPLIGRSFEEALAQRMNQVSRMTSKSAAEQAAQDTIDRLRGRV
jgi:phage head maturation protease